MGPFSANSTQALRYVDAYVGQFRPFGKCGNLHGRLTEPLSVRLIPSLALLYHELAT